MPEFNSDIVTSTLQQVVKILDNNKIEYRFLGSVVIAAINGQLHRNLGDLDFIVDSKGKDILYNELKQLGYRPAPGMFNFARKYLSLEQFDHTNLLGVGYFYGKWQTDGSFIMGNKKNRLYVEGFALKKTKYSIHGVEFWGIPPEAAATGVKESETNPKRKKELLILREKGIKPFPNNYIQVKLNGIRVDWVYHLSMAVLNVIGGIRVKFGLPFDPWR